LHRTQESIAAYRMRSAPQAPELFNSQFWRKCVLTLRSKLCAAVLLFLGTVCLAGCPQRTTIANINRDPGRYAGKEVTIAGEVHGSFGALGTGVFEVDDGTGRLWVLSENFGVPGDGARVAVTGTIQQGVSFGGKNFATILRETQKRH